MNPQNPQCESVDLESMSSAETKTSSRIAGILSNLPLEIIERSCSPQRRRLILLPLFRMFQDTLAGIYRLTRMRLSDRIE